MTQSVRAYHLTQHTSAMLSTWSKSALDLYMNYFFYVVMDVGGHHILKDKYLVNLSERLSTLR